MASAVTETLQPSGETGKNQNKQNECDQLENNKLYRKLSLVWGKLTDTVKLQFTSVSFSTRTK